MKQILAGVDGSEPAETALGWAGRFAALEDAEVIVTTVVEPHDADITPGPFDDLLRNVQAHLDGDWSRPLDAAGVAHRSILLTGEPHALQEAAEREDADLVVVGTRGGGGFAGLHIGSVASHLAHVTDRPLAIVPQAGATAALDRLVVGVDGSPGSAAAVAWCAAFAAHRAVDVLAVHAFEPFAEWVPESDHRGWRRAAEQRMETEWIAPMRDAGVTVRTRIIQDVHPVAGLAVAAGEDRAGLIVVGQRGSGGLGIGLGRIPLQLVHQSQLPVVIVPEAKP